MGVLVALLPLQLLALIPRQQPAAGDPPPRAAPAAADPAPTAPPAADHLVAPAAPAPQPETAAAPTSPGPPDTTAAPAPPSVLVTEPDGSPTPGRARAMTVARDPFAERWPAQAAAVQDPTDPASTRWALLIGINEHLGRVNDNIGSRQDAEDLRALLLANGWRDDHILLISDRDATRANIVAGIGWLAQKTDQHSVAVFHYSGHSKKWYGVDHDGDGEVTDEGLWPTDDRFIPDSELVALLDPVRPYALWANFATCNAAGFADPGLARPGRLLTFSSGEPQKSYEHPEWQNSVWGWWLLEQAMLAGRGDRNGDGRVTVEEAFAWARPLASETTSRQSHGPQDAVIVDLVDGDFDLVIPARRTGAGEPAPGAGPGAPAPGAPERREGSRICVLCGSR